MLVDLHIHTTASDGTWTPKHLIGQIKKRGLGLFAVADHDSIDSVDETQRLVEHEKGLKFIKGVEISASFKHSFFHILGYGINVHDKGIFNLLKHNVDLFNEFQKKIVKHFSLSVEEFVEYKNDHSRGGMKALNFFLDKGACNDLDHYLKMIYKDNKFEPPAYLAVENVIKVIHAAGGVSILAHPGSTLTNDGLTFADIEEMIEIGVNGLECYSQYHTKEMTAKFVKFCHKRKLLITGGSDCHGNLIAARRLGYPEVHLSQLNLGKLLTANCFFSNLTE